MDGYCRSDKDNEFVQCPSGFLCAYTSYCHVTAQQKGPCEIMAPLTDFPASLFVTQIHISDFRSLVFCYTADSTLRHRIYQMSVKEDELELFSNWVGMNESD